LWGRIQPGREDFSISSAISSAPYPSTTDSIPNISPKASISSRLSILGNRIGLSALYARTLGYFPPCQDWKCSATDLEVLNHAGNPRSPAGKSSAVPW